MNPLSSTGPLWTVREAGDLMLMVQHSSMLMVETEDWMFSPGCLGVSRWFSSPPDSTSSWLGVLTLRERMGTKREGNLPENFNSLPPFGRGNSRLSYFPNFPVLALVFVPRRHEWFFISKI